MLKDQQLDKDLAQLTFLKELYLHLNVKMLLLELQKLLLILKH